MNSRTLVLVTRVVNTFGTTCLLRPLRLLCLRFDQTYVHYGGSGSKAIMFHSFCTRLRSCTTMANTMCETHPCSQGGTVTWSITVRCCLLFSLAFDSHPRHCCPDQLSESYVVRVLGVQASTMALHGFVCGLIMGQLFVDDFGRPTADPCMVSDWCL